MLNYLMNALEWVQISNVDNMFHHFDKYKKDMG